MKADRPRRATETRPARILLWGEGLHGSAAARGPVPNTDTPPEVELARACSCGCDHRGDWSGPGYLIFRLGAGRGFTVLLEDEETFQAVAVELRRGLPLRRLAVRVQR